MTNNTMDKTKHEERIHAEDIHSVDAEGKVENDTLALYHSYTQEDAAAIEKRLVRKLDMVDLLPPIQQIIELIWPQRVMPVIVVIYILNYVGYAVPSREQ